MNLSAVRLPYFQTAAVLYTAPAQNPKTTAFYILTSYGRQVLNSMYRYSRFQQKFSPTNASRRFRQTANSADLLFRHYREDAYTAYDCRTAAAEAPQDCNRADDQHQNKNHAVLTHDQAQRQAMTHRLNFHNRSQHLILPHILQSRKCGLMQVLLFPAVRRMPCV